MLGPVLEYLWNLLGNPTEGERFDGVLATPEKRYILKTLRIISPESMISASKIYISAVNVYGG